MFLAGAGVGRGGGAGTGSALESKDGPGTDVCSSHLLAL